jgi:hypothetical protein
MQSAKSLAVGSNVALIAGGVVFATGIIVLATTKPGGVEVQTFHLGPMIGEGHGVVLGGKF